jgi:enamine deaminase RidA (YjgF/YER057c/UK114 family)
MTNPKSNWLLMMAGLLTLAMFTACAQQNPGPEPLSRTPVDPWGWGAQYGLRQGEVIQGGSKTLVMSGQVSIDSAASPMHAGDYRAQWDLALANVDAVLTEADMTMSDVVHFTIFTTHMDSALAHWDLFKTRMDAAGVMPTQSLIGVAALFLPELMIEIEATAMK